MANLKDLNKAWGKSEKLEKLVRTLKESDGELAIRSNSSQLLSFLKSDYSINDPRTADRFTYGDLNNQISFANDFLYNRKIESAKKFRSDIAVISQDLKSDDLEKIAYLTVPLDDIDLERADKLDDVVKDYTATAIQKRAELATIDQNADPVAYEAVEGLAKEYEGFVSVINDYKPLVKDIAKYKELVSHLSSNRGKPNNSKLKKLVEAEIKDIETNPNLNENEKLVLKIAKSSIKNEHNLINHYVGGIVKPAENKIKSTIASGHYNIKEYLDRTVGVMNSDRASSFFDIVYANAD